MMMKVKMKMMFVTAVILIDTKICEIRFIREHIHTFISIDLAINRSIDRFPAIFYDCISEENPLLSEIFVAAGKGEGEGGLNSLLAVGLPFELRFSNSPTHSPVKFPGVKSLFGFGFGSSSGLLFWHQLALRSQLAFLHGSRLRSFCPPLLHPAPQLGPYLFLLP